MAVFQTLTVRNRLLSMFAPDDFDHFALKLERVPMPLKAVVIAARQPIHHVLFPESGIISTVANTDEGRIEVGITGREGFIGVPAVLGVNSTPQTSLVQGEGEALRISLADLRAAIAARPALSRPLSLYIHTLMIQVAQTAYANVTLTIEARLARWVLMTQDRTDGAELMLTHEFLSVMLGSRRPGVTLATHSLEAMGAIETRRGRIVVQDRDKLKEIAGDAYQIAEDEYARVMTDAGC